MARIRFALFGFAALISAMMVANTASAQQIVKFQASEPYNINDGQLRGELYVPKGDGPFPAVVLMHGCGGWQPAVRFALQTHARALRDNGFVVLNLDSFGPRRSGGGRMCSSNRKLYKALSYRTYDAFDALRYLQAMPEVMPDNIFLMGQSNGGAVAIRAAKASAPGRYNDDGDTFRGIVAYYPWCGEFGASRVDLASPLLIFAGGRDDWVPASDCKGVRSKGADLELKIYPRAAHSFDLDIMMQRYGGKLIGGDRQATQDSRRRMLAFFMLNLTDEHRSAHIAKYGSEEVALANTQ